MSDFTSVMGLVYLSIGAAMMTLLFGLMIYKLGNLAKSLSMISANVLAIAILKTALLESDYESKLTFSVGTTIIFVIQLALRILIGLVYIKNSSILGF